MNEAVLQSAWRLQQAGRHADAAKLYAEVLRSDPRQFDALYQLANIYLAGGHFADAERLYAAAARVNAESAELFYNRGCALQNLGRNEDALAAFARALAIRPGYAEARNNRGVVLLALGRPLDALQCFDRVLAERPDLSFANNNRSTALFALRHPEEALEAAGQALRDNPRFADALCSQGAALVALGRPKEALQSFDRALFANPNCFNALVHRGIALAVLSRHEEAISSYNNALALKPDSIETLYNRATSYWSLKRFEESARDCERVLAQDSHFKYARGNLVLNRMQCCDWRDVAAHKARIAADLDSGVLSLNALASIAIFDSPKALLKVARIWTAQEAAQWPDSVWRGERYRHERIRVAYVSGDFRQHAVSLLAAGVFEHHDRTQFDTFGISLAPGDGTPLRTRMENAFGRFIDAHDKPDAEIAKLMRELEIDIAVDLMGYTEGARTAIFARRPSGIQVNWLGYPGTMGAPYMDYILADRTVIPEENRADFSETVAYLPHCYLPNDSTRELAAPPSRGAAGLPENAFVFACFNNLFKITPETFDCWMRLLGGVEGSVLWLSQPNPSAMRNLKREAEARGVAGERILFAPFVASPGAHLARLSLADLFLDTLPYNAHASACDALWAGVPALTLKGASFAGRVGASLLSTLGLPELIAQTPAEYEATALRLACDPGARTALREKLARNRLTLPLFDTARFTRGLEAAYRTMWERHQSGAPPASFGVPEAAAP